MLQKIEDRRIKELMCPNSIAPDKGGIYIHVHVLFLNKKWCRLCVLITTYIFIPKIYILVEKYENANFFLSKKSTLSQKHAYIILTPLSPTFIQ